MKKIQAVRGMSDLLPTESGVWRYVVSVLEQVVDSYGYQFIQFPIVEKTDLFTSSIGQGTDIVNKEMYTFADRNGEMLTLRPEGTAGCMRAGIEQGLFYNQMQRLWYCGSMFRYERPQKGRLRQFYQFGVEAVGMGEQTSVIDVELLQLSRCMWQRLGILPQLELQINSLGNPVSRDRYREHLVAYFKQHQQVLDEDSQRRLETNPLRILDSKNPDMAALIDAAPKLVDHLDDESAASFKAVCGQLDALSIDYTINPNLVRGLDYYSNLVFEWVAKDLGSQGTVCAGGSYPYLVERLGGKSTSACGFAIGIERLVSLIDQPDQYQQRPFIYIVSCADGIARAMQIADELRQIVSRPVIVDCAGGSFKSQFKRADKSQAELALVLGDDEIQAQQVLVKSLRQREEQQVLDQAQLNSFIESRWVQLTGLKKRD